LRSTESNPSVNQLYTPFKSWYASFVFPCFCHSLRLGIQADDAVRELAKVAFASISDIHLDWDKVKDWNDLTEEQKVVIAGLKVTETKGVDWTKKVTEIKLHDKLQALDMLSKHLGIYEKHNRQKQLPVINLNLVDSNPRTSKLKLNKINVKL